MYHDIVTNNDMSSGFQDNAAFQYKVNIDQFEEQAKSLSADEVTFTFDDGGKSFLTIAAPILEKYGHRGIFFIATDYIGTPGFLSVKQIKELDARGHIIGSHSCSHPDNMSILSEDDIETEWNASIKKLEEIVGCKVEYASIPNGFASEVIYRKAKLVGIRYLYTSIPSDKIRIYKDMLLIGRYVVHSSMSSTAVLNLVHSAFARKQRYARYRIIEFVKFILGNKYNKFKKVIVQKYS